MILSPAICADIIHYQEYGWKWGIITQLINRFHGTTYTSKALQRLWQQELKAQKKASSADSQAPKK